MGAVRRLERALRARSLRVVFFGTIGPRRSDRLRDAKNKSASYLPFGRFRRSRRGKRRRNGAHHRIYRASASKAPKLELPTQNDLSTFFPPRFPQRGGTSRPAAFYRIPARNHFRGGVAKPI